MKTSGNILVILFLIVNALNASAQNDSLINQTDAGSLKQGYWERYYPNGKLMYQGYFSDDLPVGEMKRYFESGNLKAILDYSKQGEYVNATLFYEDGSKAAEGIYYNMMKDSTWRYYSYYDQTIAAEETYDKGKRHGPMRSYYSDGTISELIEWKDQVRHGLWMQYFNNSNIRLKGTYVEGMLEGEFIVYFEDGTTCLTGSYLNDQPDGLWRFYNEDGSVSTELTYDKGTNLNQGLTDEMQEELFRTIEENRGRFDEPDETEFLMPSGR